MTKIKGNLFKYAGSKFRVAEQIYKYFPDKMYVEVFGGSGAILVQKKLHRRELYNDINSDLVNLYEVLAFQYEDFSAMVKYLVNAKETYDRIRDIKDTRGIDPVTRAVYTYYLFKFGFGGHYNHSWSLDIQRNGKNEVNMKLLDQIHNRVRHVQFTNYHYKELIEKTKEYDCYYYMDPPYPNMSSLYNSENHFNTENFEEYIQTIEKQWFMSYPVVPELDIQIYTKEIQHHYSLSKSEKVTEYLISNRPFQTQNELGGYF